MRFLALLVGLLAGLIAAATAAAQDFERPISLVQVGTYASGVFDEGAAEIVAYDPGSRRLVVVNGDAETIDILDIGDPARPTKVGAIDVTPFGASPNSVDVYDGLAAVAVEADPKTDPGRVAFFDV